MSLSLTLEPAYPLSLLLETQGEQAVVNTQPSAVLALAAIIGALGSVGSGVTFEQLTPATTWNINHNLGYRPSVEVFSVGGAEIDAEVLHLSVNQTQIHFVVATAGSARLN